jgi:type IX secretion system PorP/SprF family membrane protein
LLFSLIQVQGQDVPYSQYYSNLVYLNPAFAGTQDMQRMNLFYRNQWPVSSAGFQSFGVAFDMPIEAYNSGVGIILSNDIAGAYVEPAVDFIYSYQIRLFKDAFISMALQGGVVQKYLNTSSLTMLDQNETASLSSGFSKIIPDFAIGATGFYKNYYTGLSVDHILQPYQGVSSTENSRLNRKYTFFLGYIFTLQSRLIKQQRILSPSLLVQIQGGQQNINWGSAFQYDWLIAGVWLRHNLKLNIDAAILMVGFKTHGMRFAYSYDMNIGKRSTMPLSSHEVSFSKLFQYTQKKRYKSLKCPSF